ncbi:MAG TPA: threonine--tRNA ligase, partial [Armatimonadota bacterium]
MGQKLTEQDELYKLRHTAAHVMAQAVKELWPTTKLTIGPPTDEGFYYDFQTERPFTQEDLDSIETRMREIVKRNLPLVREELSIEDSLKLFREIDEPFKLEMIEALPEGEGSSVYRQGDFVDWCRGPHVHRTGNVKHFKVLHSSAAYWHGDAKLPQLQRVYGTAFKTKDELDQYLVNLEEAKKRDHRKLGRELGIFILSPEVGSGLPLWLPKGAVLRDVLQTFIRTELEKRGYLPVVTPHVAKASLYAVSGHLQAYQDGLWPPMHADEGDYYLKPVNCPHHIQIFKALCQSYRDLPIRLAEFGTVYRYEQSGEVGGLTRVRGFTQDDAHLFMTPAQLPTEFKSNVELIQLVFKRLGLNDVTARVGLRDQESDKYVGSPEAWEQSQSALLQAVREIGMDHTVEEGEAAIYGPKLDFMVRDAIGREWQLGTVQVDYVLPERFGLEYTGEDGEKHRPVMIHRAPFGSFERFIGILIEHFAGAFPFWLSPEQVRLLPIADRHHGYAAEIAGSLKAVGIRVEVDTRNEKLGYKIREGQLAKVPYMLVVGDKDLEA